jgi:hypothetical protein
LRDGLYDQLFTALRQDPEPLASDREYRQWLDAWTAAHPARSAPLLSEEQPWPVQRHQALKFLTLFPLNVWGGTWQTLRECGEEVPFPPEETVATWQRWRVELLDRYRLHDVLAAEGASSPTVTSHGAES